MEGYTTYKQKLFNSNVFSNVMQFFDMKELIDFRTISQKMADEFVPRCINHLKYECAEEDDDMEYDFPKRVRYAKKVEIKNICGT
jgi:hypothetical protein